MPRPCRGGTGLMPTHSIYRRWSRQVITATAGGHGSRPLREMSRRTCCGNGGRVAATADVLRQRWASDGGIAGRHGSLPLREMSRRLCCSNGGRPTAGRRAGVRFRALRGVARFLQDNQAQLTPATVGRAPSYDDGAGTILDATRIPSTSRNLQAVSALSCRVTEAVPYG